MIQISISFCLMSDILLILFPCSSWNIYWTAMISWSIFIVALVWFSCCMNFKKAMYNTLIPGLLGVSNTNLMPIYMACTAAKKSGLSSLVCCWYFSFCTLRFMISLKLLGHISTMSGKIFSMRKFTYTYLVLVVPTNQLRLLWHIILQLIND